MSEYQYPNHRTSNGYLTGKIQQEYIQWAIDTGLLPENAHRMPHIVSLDASNESAVQIQFWQLYSVLGQERIVKIVRSFYRHVFADEPWFTSVFEKVGGIEHHVQTQSAMWVDVMGGGLAYHGGEYRLSFHHTHNAMQLMNEKGAARWVELMVTTLNDSSIDLTSDPRVRLALNSFLSHFLGKYADEFQFSANSDFGEINSAQKRKNNLLNMTSDAIEALSETELKAALSARGIDVSQFVDKQAMVNQALRL